jgi:hypothetical protein
MWTCGYGRFQGTRIRGQGRGRICENDRENGRRDRGLGISPHPKSLTPTLSEGEGEAKKIETTFRNSRSEISGIPDVVGTSSGKSVDKKGSR